MESTKKIHIPEHLKGKELQQYLKKNKQKLMKRKMNGVVNKY